jgi:sugar/nucleoside kinase (ribokinase family)
MSSAAPAPDFLVLGHLSLDQSSTGVALGGTAAYAALTARALGRHPAIVTAAGSDLDLSPLDGIPLRRLESPQSTTFVNDYREGGRRQRLLARASPLESSAIPAGWRSASIVHLAPIAGEVPPLLADLFSDSEVVGLTPQGWMRAWDADGWVRFTTWSPAIAAIRRADVVIVGSEDVGGDEGELENLASVCRLLVVTEGPLGARVYWNGDVRRFPPPAADPVDPTGAGDIFAASFFIRFQQTRDPWEAARFANLLASASVTRRGLHGVPTPEEAERAAMVWTR